MCAFPPEISSFLGRSFSHFLFNICSTDLLGLCIHMQHILKEKNVDVKSGDYATSYCPPLIFHWLIIEVYGNRKAFPLCRIFKRHVRENKLFSKNCVCILKSIFHQLKTINDWEIVLVILYWNSLLIIYNSNFSLESKNCWWIFMLTFHPTWNGWLFTSVFRQVDFEVSRMLAPLAFNRLIRTELIY